MEWKGRAFEAKDVDQVIAGLEGAEDVYAFMETFHKAEWMTAERAWELGLKFGETLNKREIIHVLHRGQSLCGEVQGAPVEWPDGHAWVTMENSAQANCTPCVDEARDDCNCLARKTGGQHMIGCPEVHKGWKAR